MRKVIDLSQHNSFPTSWEMVKAEVDGVILRCGYRGYGKSGTLVEDKKFRHFKKMCKLYQIPWGVYFFPTAVSISEAREESGFVANLIAGEDVSFPIFADSEKSHPLGLGRSDNLSKADRTTYLIEFLEGMKVYGYNAGVYASTSWFKDRLDDSRLLKYPHWVAQYAKKCTYSGNMDGWQFSSKESVTGIPGRVDMSEWYGPQTETHMIALPTLRRGNKGAEVIILQSNLQACGYAIPIDGSFGPATEGAVKNWQRLVGLNPDGIYGPKSYAAMKQALE